MEIFQMTAPPFHLPPAGADLSSINFNETVQYLKYLEFIRIFNAIHDLFENHSQLFALRQTSKKGTAVFERLQFVDFKVPSKKVQKTIQKSLDQFNDQLKQHENLVSIFILNSLEEYTYGRLIRDNYQKIFNDFALAYLDEKDFIQTLQRSQQHHQIASSTPKVFASKQQSRL